METIDQRIWELEQLNKDEPKEVELSDDDSAD